MKHDALARICDETVEGDAETESQALGLGDLIAQRIETYFSMHDDGLPTAGLYDRIVREVELPLLRMTMDACRGNQLKAAGVLGINRNTLRKKLRDLGIMPDEMTKRRDRWERL